MSADVVKVYNCVVRLGGSLLHTVPKERISGEEVRLLKSIHGDDAIANLKEIGHLDGWARDDELNMLADRYSQEPDKRDGRRLVEKVFGTLLTNFDAWLLAKEEEREAEEAETAVMQKIEDAARGRGTLVRSGATS